MYVEVICPSTEPGSKVRLSDMDSSSICAGSWTSGPALRLNELLKQFRVMVSELMKTDPDFPKDTSLHDCDSTPKFYWTPEAMTWLEGRADTFRSRQKGD